MEWYIGVLKQYTVFSGRSRRKEYWMFTLVNTAIFIALSIIDGILGLGFLALIYNLAVLLPSIGVSIRRLHDTGRTGWWLLIMLVPLIGILVLIYFLVQDSAEGENDYGVTPKLAAA